MGPDVVAPAWSRFGQAEGRGALNYVTPEGIRSAAGLVRKGQVLPLNARLDPEIVPVGRPALKREIRMHNHRRPLGGGRTLVLNDENVAFALQGSSHLDAFAHFGLVEPGVDGVFYGGAGLEDTEDGDRSRTRGIDSLGGAIVTRGVLVDLAALFPGHAHVPDGERIGRASVEARLRDQGVNLRSGDAVLFFTGYEERVRRNGGHPPDRVAGIDGTTLALWRDSEVALLAADNLTVEAYPGDYAIHIGALRNLGIPLGELWSLEGLASACRADGTYDFLLVSVPLNLPGAFGSPANAVALR